jgi:acid phosphatase family membrane protein YuiD
MDHSIEISISVDNDAFGITYSDQANEVARILDELSDKLVNRPKHLSLASDSLNLKDINGNTVGFFRIVSS